MSVQDFREQSKIRLNTKNERECNTCLSICLVTCHRETGTFSYLILRVLVSHFKNVKGLEKKKVHSA